MEITKCPPGEAHGYRTDGLTAQLSALAARLPPPCSGKPPKIEKWNKTSRTEWSEILGQGYLYKVKGT